MNLHGILYFFVLMNVFKFIRFSHKTVIDKKHVGRESDFDTENFFYYCVSVTSLRGIRNFVVH